VTGSPRRRRLVLGGYLLLTVASLAVGVLTSEPSDWRPFELLLVLIGFSIASELLPVELRPRTYPLGGWYFTSSAPFVLAAVCLGPAPSVVVVFAGLAVSSFVERPPWPHLVMNVANYAFFSVSSALVAGAAIDAFDIGVDDASLAVLAVAVYAFDIAVSFVMTVGHDALLEGEPLRETDLHPWAVQLRAEAPVALLTGLTVHLYGTSGLGALVVLVAVQLMFVHVARELHRSTRRAGRISELSASRGKLVGQILDAEEGERRRLADALHDDAMQNLLAARQDLAEAPSDPSVERARGALEASIDQLRETIFTLHPTVLEHVGLAAAIESVALAHARRGGFVVTVQVEPAASCERDALTFTVCRELLSNAAEHAGAANVAVRVARSSAGVTIQVMDDGRGFTAQSLGAALQLGHIGLASISERIDALGGSFKIDSEHGPGTRVVATLPIDSHEVVSVAAPAKGSDPLRLVEGWPVLPTR
jgi:signal transduction histidine kinase